MRLGRQAVPEGDAGLGVGGAGGQRGHSQAVGQGALRSADARGLHRLAVDPAEAFGRPASRRCRGGRRPRGRWRRCRPRLSSRRERRQGRRQNRRIKEREGAGHRRAARRRWGRPASASGRCLRFRPGDCRSARRSFRRSGARRCRVRSAGASAGRAGRPAPGRAAPSGGRSRESRGGGRSRRSRGRGRRPAPRRKWLRCRSGPARWCPGARGRCGVTGAAAVGLVNLTKAPSK